MTAIDRPTVVVSRSPRPGCESAFATWVEGFTATVETVAGYVSHQVVAPIPGAQPDWVFVFTFDSPGHLRTWVDSDLRRTWIEKAEPLLHGEARAQVISGLEILFGLRPPTLATPPAVWKLALATLGGLWPVAYLNALTLGPALAPHGPGLRTLVVSVVTVAEMTWIVMPLVTRGLRGWLQPDRKSIATIESR